MPRALFQPRADPPPSRRWSMMRGCTQGCSSHKDRLGSWGGGVNWTTEKPDEHLSQLTQVHVCDGGHAPLGGWGGRALDL